MEKRIKKSGVKPAIKRNPAATTTGGAGIILVAALNFFNITLTQEQINALIVIVALIPGIINWIKTKWDWLSHLVDSGYEKVEDEVTSAPTG